MDHYMQGHCKLSFNFAYTSNNSGFLHDIFWWMFIGFQIFNAFHIVLNIADVLKKIKKKLFYQVLIINFFLHILIFFSTLAFESFGWFFVSFSNLILHYTISGSKNSWEFEWRFFFDDPSLEFPKFVRI